MKRGAREEQRDHGATFRKVQATGDVCTGNGMDEALGVCEEDTKGQESQSCLVLTPAVRDKYYISPDT